MVIENLELLEERISKLLKRFQLVVQQKNDLEQQVNDLKEGLLQKDAEFDVLKQALKNKSSIEEINKQYEEERSTLKSRTLNILSQLEQLESLLEQDEQNMQQEERADQEHSENESEELGKATDDPLDEVDAASVEEPPEDVVEPLHENDVKKDDRQQTLPFGDAEDIEDQGQEHHYGE